MSSDEKKRSAITRRRAVTALAAGVTGVAAGAGGAALVGSRSPPPEGPRWRFLTPAEAALVDAISGRLIPADADPGAREARVVRFVDRQLVGPYRRFQTTYREGLAGVRATCERLHGKTFDALTPRQQTGFLEQLERGEVPANLWNGDSARSFFNLLVDHTMQGFYGPPRHGGNRNWVSYRMLGLEAPRVIGRNSPPA